MLSFRIIMKQIKIYLLLNIIHDKRKINQSPLETIMFILLASFFNFLINSIFY